jgi:hypothetical protein
MLCSNCLIKKRALSTPSMWTQPMAQCATVRVSHNAKKARSRGHVPFASLDPPRETADLVSRWGGGPPGVGGPRGGPPGAPPPAPPPGPPPNRLTMNQQAGPKSAVSQREPIANPKGCAVMLSLFLLIHPSLESIDRYFSFDFSASCFITGCIFPRGNVSPKWIMYR